MFKIGAFYCPRESKRIFLWTCIPREFWIKVWAAWFQRASLIAIHSVCITCKSSVLRARRVPHGAFKEEMRDSLSPSPSLLSPPPPLLFGFHWKSFFFLCRFPSRAARPYTTCYLTPWSLHTKLVGAGKRPFSVFFFFWLTGSAPVCVCVSLCVSFSICIFPLLLPGKQQFLPALGNHDHSKGRQCTVESDSTARSGTDELSCHLLAY